MVSSPIALCGNLGKNCPFVVVMLLFLLDLILVCSSTITKRKSHSANLSYQGEVEHDLPTLGTIDFCYKRSWLRFGGKISNWDHAEIESYYCPTSDIVMNNF